MGWPTAAPSSLRVFYSPDLVSESGGTASPSARKPKAVFDALIKSDWPIEIIAPEPAGVADLCRVHDPLFVVEVLELRRPNGFGSVSESIARSLPYTSGACLGSALVALNEGVSASLTSGFHHAGPRGARGFCTFNGLMVTIANLLANRRLERVAIIDCDYHFGDGTQAIIDEQRLSNQVLHVSFGERFRFRHQAAGYLEEVNQLGDRLTRFAPQLILYQAGADTHVDDPLGGLLSTDEMRQRDRAIFTIARELKIPLTWNLAGGYQVERDGTIPRIVQLHLNTFEEALAVWEMN